MIIGQFCETYPPSLDGVGRVMLAYCQTQEEMGHRSLYIAPSNPAFPQKPVCETLLYPGISIPGEPYRVGIPRLSRHFRKAARQISFDVVHAHSPFLAGREAKRLAKRSGAPLVATFHSKYYDDFYAVTHSHAISRLCLKYVLRFFYACDEVWAVNHKTAQTLRDYGFQKEIIIMPNGTNPLSVTPQQREATFRQFPIREGVPVFLYAGQQNNKKNIEKILRACAQLQDEGMDFQLLMVGDGPDRSRLGSLATSLALGERTLFTGFLDHRPTLLSLYERADLLVFPSLYDNAPMVVREAAAMGTPALLVEGTCSAEGVRHGHNGFLCQDSVESIAQGMKEALPHCPEVGLEAKKTIPIPWGELMPQIIGRYQGLIQQKKS